MEAIDISSSDSDVEIEVAHTDNRSQFPVSSDPYRKLPPWYFNPTSNSESESAKQATHIDTENALLSAPVSSTTHGDLPSRPHPYGSNSDSSDGEVEVVQYSGSSVPLRPHLSSSNSESRSEMGTAHINKGNAFPAAPVPSTSYRRLPSWPDPSISNSKGSGGSNQKQPLHSLSVLDSRSNGRISHERLKTDNVSEASSLPTSLGELSQGKLRYDPRVDYRSGRNPVDRNFYMKDDLGREKDDDIMIYENAGTRRLLPSSLMAGKPVSISQNAGPSDAMHNSGVGEERPVENDERVIFQAALQDLSQPKTEANLPDGLLAVPLLRHQKIALAWMLQKETASLHCLGGILADDQGLGKTVSVIALILMQKFLQSKSPSNNSSRIETEALNLDEDDDCIPVMEEVSQNGGSHDSRWTQAASSVLPMSQKGKQKGKPAAGTLVVCPASVLRQWGRELDEKVCAKAKLKVLFYHGGARTKDPVELAKYDVVLTTYAIVSNEVPKQPLADDEEKEHRNSEKYELSSEFSTNKKRKKTSNAGKKGKKRRKGIDGSTIDCESGPLARVVWLRVVLDEAQTIKNHRTQVARACCGLRAKRRWCLSGTPIQNAIDDLYSYFRFLKYDPYSVYKSFCSSIKHPISRNASSGYMKLQAVLKTIMLRRTKGTLLNGEPIIQLPPKSICLKKVEFSDEERAFYSRLEAESRSQFKEYAAAGTVKQNYANILLMLLRLRQACDHPLLVKGCHSDSVGEASVGMARKLPREMLINLLGCLEVSLAICGVCSDPPEDAVVTMCGHVFCYQCVSEYLTGDDNQCPAADCKQQLATDVVFSRATLRRSISDELGNNTESSFGLTEECRYGRNISTSSKIRATLDILCSLRNARNPTSTSDCISEHFYSDVHDAKDNSTNSRSQYEPEKAIIFSQWTSMLDLLEVSLNSSCMQYRRLDGTMTLASRDKAVKDFSTDPEVNVMIMSLKAGNLGLNMVAACHVILLDLWWNPTTEDQAIDRAHRIGQTRPVTVSRLTIKDTVEDRILALQVAFFFLEEKRKMVSSAFGEDQTGSFATRLTVEDLRYLFMV
ncbi:helicase-like protein transcription factor CHR28 isoform X1 [Cinnamomum micranthum f. kanehirae]|uniref:Helicase-like protein transcription factor CHR28 isoform X1 n=1 Tax=Cinnamomum micranthum f. kanehirae TaxID=337451 RepID=A0A3S3NQU6_9MAGN|nr:helicase-like protein transcription factor CHR28 isoform X1 [Cinnamomum micranthum f. kanehirae]